MYRRSTAAIVAMLGLLLPIGLTSVGAESATTPQAPEPTFAFLHPAPGESLMAGTTEHIRWEINDAAGPGISSVVIDFSDDGRLSWQPIVDAAIAPNDPTWGDLPWLVPADLEGVTIHLRIAPYGGTDPVRVRVIQPATGLRAVHATQSR